MLIDPKRFHLSWRRQIVLNLFISIFLILFGNINLLFSKFDMPIEPLWSASGIALGFTLLFGVQTVLPGLIMGFFVLAYQMEAPPFTALGVFLSNLLSPTMASMLLLSYGNNLFRMKNLKDIASFVFLAALMVPFLFSTTSLAFHYYGGLISSNELSDKWLIFFSRNVLSVLIFTPLIASLFTYREKKSNRLEGVIFFLTLGAVTYWSLGGNSTKGFLIVPFIIWGSIRYSIRGISYAAIFLSLIALWKSTHIPGLFDSSNPDSSIIWIQCLSGGSTLVGYFLNTVTEAHERANAKELESHINLTHKKIAEEALAILDQSIQKSPIGFSLVDRRMRFIRINERMAELNGEPTEFHLGRTIREMVPELADEIEGKVQQVFLTGESLLNIPMQGISKTEPHELISGLQSYYPVRHPITDEIFGVAISFQNLTEQVKIQELLEKNQARLHYAQEASKSGAFEWDLENNRILWTPEMERIYGLLPGEFGGFYESWIKLIHPDDLEFMKNEVRKVLDGCNELNLEFRIITKKNDTRWILARGKKIGQKGSERFIGINIDLTEQKYAEQKLKVTEANLLHALSVRDEFMAIASHELKTPLTSLKLQQEIFARGISRDSNFTTTPKVQTLLERNSKQIDRLTRLVDDMLDISRIRTGKLTIKRERSDLNTILKEIITRLKEQFENSGSGMPEVEYAAEAVGDWDPLRIEQVVTNIITNAIRYGRGRPITIALKTFHESVRLSVKDQGLGIAKSDQKKIFQRYERGLLAREVSGLGLGLFICEQIVGAHGGSIWVESEVNQGSIFYVDLPRITRPALHHLTQEAIPVES